MAGYNLDFVERVYPSIKPIKMPSREETRAPRVKSYESGNPIPFSMGLAEEVRYFIEQTFAQKEPLINLDPPRHIPKEVQGELKRFQCAIVSYYESPNPVIPPSVLLDGITKGEEFITWLKKVRMKSFIMSTGSGRITDPSDLINIPYYQITDIGDIFNYRYWFFWDQKDEHDEQYYFQPIKRLSESSRRKFKEACLRILPESATKVPREEILATVSSSGCLKDKTYLSSKHYKEVQQSNYCATTPLKGKHTYVQKCPGDTRAAITLDVPHSNSVRVIERNLSLIASQIPWSCYVSDNSEFEKRFDKFRGNSAFFFCRDIKKDGLTKNRELVQLVLECINEKFPQLELKVISQIYDDFFVEIDKVEANPPRGVGLGMSSAITTIIQSTLFEITVDDIVKDEDVTINGKIDAIFYHDDAAIGLTDENDIDEYVYKEGQVFDEYQIIRNLRKSLEGTEFVLCERYSDTSMDTKMSMLIYLLRLPFAAINVAHAKSLFQQVAHLDVEGLPIGDYINDLIAYWGYEFHCDEGSKPYLLGGWLPSKYLGCDTTLWYYDQDSYTDLRCMHACIPEQLRMPTRKKDKDPYNSPVEQIYGENLNLNGQESLYFYKVHKWKVSTLMSRFLRPGTLALAWNRVLKKRQKFFQRRAPALYTMEEAYMTLCRLHPGLDFLPTPTMVPEESIDEYPVHDEPFPLVTPYLSYLKYWNPSIKVDKTIIPCPAPPNSRIYNKSKLTAQERRLAQDYSRTLTGFHTGKIPLFWVNNFYYTRGYWNQPQAVCAAWQSLTGRFGMPDISRFVREDQALKSFRQMMSSFAQSDYLPLYKWTLRTLGWDKLVEVYQLQMEETLLSIIKSVKAQRKPPEPKPEIEVAPKESKKVFGFDNFNEYLEGKDYPFEYPIFKTAYVNLYTHYSDLRDSMMGACDTNFDHGTITTIEPLSYIEQIIWLKSGGTLDPERPEYILLEVPQTGSDTESEILNEEFDPFDFG